MAWRLAKSLETLRAQINARHPNRSKVSDGTVGDAKHASRKSDHNPNSAGVVCALDITHDPAHGVDTWKLAETLRQVRDPRISYVISNGRIFSSQVSKWQWRPYTGPNKHAHHVHVSVIYPLGDNLQGQWNLDGPASGPAPEPKPVPPAPPKGITADLRRRMAKQIVDYEARRDGKGRLMVFHPPANDGGGAYEVAGINVRFHPQQAAKLKSLIEAGKHDEAEASVIEYLLAYTAVASGWTTDAGVEFYCRDGVFNRGPKGAARILQRAVGVKDDGEVGPLTRAALERIPRDQILTRLRTAREDYERNVVGYRANFWRGLVNRWDKALVAARAFQKEQGAIIPAPAKGPATVATSTAVAAWSLWDWIVAHPLLTAILAMIAIAGGLFAWNAYKEWRDRPPAAPVAPVPATQEEPA